MQDSLFQYVAGPVQLVGLLILVLAVKFAQHQQHTKSRRALVWGMLGLGILVVFGGIGRELNRRTNAAVTDHSISVHGAGNSITGVRSSDKGVSIAAGGDIILESPSQSETSGGKGKPSGGTKK